jgi:hypothetical protein
MAKKGVDEKLIKSVKIRALESKWLQCRRKNQNKVYL